MQWLVLKIGIKDDNGAHLAVFLVLIIASASAIGYFAYAAANGKGPTSYNTMYVLDQNKRAVDYNETLIANQNTTFTVWLYVENHMQDTGNQTYQVLVKVTPNISSIPVVANPVQTYDISIQKGNVWQNQVNVSENEVGSYFVVFELYHINKDNGYTFTNNYCILNMQVVN